MHVREGDVNHALPASLGQLSNEGIPDTIWEKWKKLFKIKDLTQFGKVLIGKKFVQAIAASMDMDKGKIKMDGTSLKNFEGTWVVPVSISNTYRISSPTLPRSFVLAGEGRGKRRCSRRRSSIPKARKHR
jgi:hypothetical protein